MAKVWSIDKEMEPAVLMFFFKRAKQNPDVCPLCGCKASGKVERQCKRCGMGWQVNQTHENGPETPVDGLEPTPDGEDTPKDAENGSTDDLGLQDEDEKNVAGLEFSHA